MHKHWWYTVDHGMGIRCDKCDKYLVLYDSDFDIIEHTEDCPISDEEMENELL